MLFNSLNFVLAPRMLRRLSRVHLRRASGSFYGGPGSGCNLDVFKVGDLVGWRTDAKLNSR
jgi:hypothetical protein